MEMVTINGVRYRLEDARRRGLLPGTKKKEPANKARSADTVSTKTPKSETTERDVSDEDAGEK